MKRKDRRRLADYDKCQLDELLNNFIQAIETPVDQLSDGYLMSIMDGCMVLVRRAVTYINDDAMVTNSPSFMLRVDNETRYPSVTVLQASYETSEQTALRGLDFFCGQWWPRLANATFRRGIHYARNAFITKLGMEVDEWLFAAKRLPSETAIAEYPGTSLAVRVAAIDTAERSIRAECYDVCDSRAKVKSFHVKGYGDGLTYQPDESDLSPVLPDGSVAAVAYYLHARAVAEGQLPEE